MKTFKQFDEKKKGDKEAEKKALPKKLQESDGMGYQFDTPEEAEAFAKNHGGQGYHQMGDKYMPFRSCEEFQTMLQMLKKRSAIAGDDAAPTWP